MLNDKIMYSYSVTIPNSDYHYGDLNKSSQKLIQGKGVIIAYAADLFTVLINDIDSHKLYRCSIENVTSLKESNDASR